MTERRFEPTGPVVVGVDGSTSSEAALRWAAGVANRSVRDLRVVLVESNPEPQYVVPREPVWPWPMLRKASPGQLERSGTLLNSLVAATLGEDQKFETVVRVGDPSAELLGEAEQQGASLLVLGRRGMGGFKSLLLGSVSDKCAGHSACPVAVIPHDASDKHGPIIVGTDGSEGSVVAARWAADYALAVGRSLRLVLCWDVGPEPYAYRHLIEDPSSTAHTTVDKVEAQIRAHAPQLAVTSTVLIGAPGKRLSELAVETEAELVVVGSRGYGGFESLVLGSVAHQTLRHVTSPIVVVRP